MQKSLEQVAFDALALPGKSRGALAKQLIDSLDDDALDLKAEAIWMKEVDRRHKEVVKGKVILIPAEKVLAKARKRYP